MNSKYLFTSKRLGFRNWKESDLTVFAEMNADADVMEHFPKTLSKQETAALLERMQQHFEKHGYTYFCTELLETGAFIGFIGLAVQEYETDFTPATDIGWRLKKSAWGKGYATEGALRCLEFGLEELCLKRIIAVCMIGNTSSENVMRKIGLEKKGEFLHPSLAAFPDYQRCIWYEIENE